MAKIAQEKQKKLSGTLDDVNHWLGELKGIANYDDAASSTMSNSFVGAAHSDAATSQAHSQKFNEGNDGVLCQMIGQLEHILQNKDS